MSVIDIKLSAIYQASHDVLPDKASSFSGQASWLSFNVDGIVDGMKLAGNHPIGPDLHDLGEELFVHLRTMVKTFNDCATALDTMADNFVIADGDAQRWMNQHQKYLGKPETALPPVPPSS